MPKTPIDYSNISFYRIVSKDLNITDCYVGSTSNITKRKYMHKYNCNNNTKKSHLKIYQFIRDNGGWESWDLIEIEKKKCDDLNDKLRRERYWIEFYQSILNMVIPSRTSIEYKEENKEKYADYIKTYQEENKEKINIQRKKYRDENKEKLKEQKKQYNNEQTKKKKAEYLKNYYINNREKLLNYQKTYKEQNKNNITK